MDRRVFLATSAAAALVPLGASAEGMIDYTPGLIETALSEGKTVLVDYSATWCSTCRRQARVINALRAADPAYDTAMIFVKVDWDTYRRDAVTVSRKIPRRSTLVLLRGDAELGRIIAKTRQDDIKALMDLGLETQS
ncbi:MAG: thioredoxin family protein [Pseudomonadota bacterium]